MIMIYSPIEFDLQLRLEKLSSAILRCKLCSFRDQDSITKLCNECNAIKNKMNNEKLNHLNRLWNRGDKQIRVIRSPTVVLRSESYAWVKHSRICN